MGTGYANETATENAYDTIGGSWVSLAIRGIRIRKQIEAQLELQ